MTGPAAGLAGAETGEDPRQGVQGTHGATSPQPARIPPERLAIFGRALAADERTRPILASAVQSIAGLTGAFAALPSNLRASVVAAAEHEHAVSRGTHSGGGVIDVAGAVDAFRRAGWAVWQRPGDQMQTRCPIDDDHYEHRWWSDTWMTGQALIQDPGWRAKPGPMITDGPPWPIVYIDDLSGDEDEPAEDPIEWDDDVNSSWDAHSVDAEDYDDPDSMINRIDYALAQHQGDTDGRA